MVVIMDLKNAIVIVLITCIFIIFLFGSLSNFFIETYDLLGEIKDVSYSSQHVKEDKVYENYKVDKSTGMVDSNGNPIYLSVISSDGGDMEPGVYEVYWSKSGVINQTRVR